MSFPRYPNYKDSGVEWLGEVPAHWKASRLKDSLKELYSGGTPESGNSEYWADDEGESIPWVAIGDMTRAPVVATTEKRITPAGLASKRLRVLPAGTLLYSMYASLGKVAVLGLPATINQAILGIVPDTGKADQGFIRYWLIKIESHLELFSSSNTQDNLNAGKVRSFALLVPPLPEQTQIAAFLDRETAKIDELVAEQQRLMELLKEKRQAVISHAVTQGLNPNAPMKPSGIEWLGAVPAHWELKATKRLFRLVAESAPDDNDHELLSIYTAIGVRPRKELEAKGNKSTTTDGYWLVQKGDLIVNKLLAWMGAIGISEYDGVTSPAYDILRQRIPLDPRFYDYLFRCGICFSEFRRWSRGIMDMRLRLYFDELGQLVMPYPPESEQREIVAFLQVELERFDTLAAESQRAIDLLQERRTALISAVVTGQIDVRHLTEKQAA